MKLPHVSGSKRGPKRLAIARKIAAASHRNWSARASMWMDGLGSKRTTYRMPHMLAVLP